MLNKSAQAVAEAVKRYALPADTITLHNNGLKPKECILMIDSFTKHYLQVYNLTISKNKLGLEGAKRLAVALADMKVLSKLVLSDDEIGDMGISEIINSCRSYCSLEYLDISGNNIGKSSAAGELAENINMFLSNNRTIEVLKMNWNSMRAATAEKIIDGLIYCGGIKELHLNNNLLGVSYDDK